MHGLRSRNVQQYNGFHYLPVLRGRLFQQYNGFHFLYRLCRQYLQSRHRRFGMSVLRQRILQSAGVDCLFGVQCDVHGHAHAGILRGRNERCYRHY